MSKISDHEVSSSQTPVNQIHYNRGSNTRPASRKVTHREVRSSRRHAPYRKTPHSRSLARHTTRPQLRTPDQAQDEAPSDYSFLLSKTWRVYRVSPLYNFDYKKGSFKRYTRSLSSHILAASKAGFGVDTTEKADNASISIYEGLRDGRGDKKAVQILLKGKPRSGKGPNVVVLRALFCGVNVTEENRLTEHTSFTNLPLMLVQGPINLGVQLIHWWKRQFDCSISPMKFSPVDLNWMVAMWAGGLVEKKPKPVEFVYKVPPGVEGLNRITMNLDAVACKQLWEKIHNGDSDDFLEESVATFVRSVEHHFYSHFKIHLRVMPLVRIGTSVAMIGSEGKLKIFSNNHVVQVLRHVTEIALER